MNFEKFLIHESATVKDALATIESNTLGTVIVVNYEKTLRGSITDGDIRRYLMMDGSLEDSVIKVMNENCRQVSEGCDRESYLKLLDNGVKVIPVINHNHQVVNIVTIQNIPQVESTKIYARSRAPVRISFGGGGSDLTHYFDENPGAVINAAISIYSRSTIRKRIDSRIRIFSSDIDCVVDVASVNELTLSSDLKLLEHIVKVVAPDFGLDLYVNSDFGVGSGLGGSSSVCLAVLGCFNEFRDDRWSKQEMAELAFQIERLHMGVSGGWQDQYAAAFGGINFIEFSQNRNDVSSLKLETETLLELQESLVLCNSNLTHQSGDVHDSQKVSMQSDSVRSLVARNVELTYEMKHFLLRGKLDFFGEALNTAWSYKRRFDASISSGYLDEIYDGAVKNGASGGKLLGAGGGGFFLFFVTPFKRQRLVDFLKSKGLSIAPVIFDEAGVTSWKFRDAESMESE